MNHVQAFRAAEAARRTAVVAWNALPNEQARAASGIDLASASRAVRQAAAALAADAAGRHRIEQRSAVYLKLGVFGWEVDGGYDCGVAVDGHGDAVNSECEHDDTAQADAECQALADASALIALPDARTLIEILTVELEYRALVTATSAGDGA